MDGAAARGRRGSLWGRSSRRCAAAPASASAWDVAAAIPRGLRGRPPGQLGQGRSGASASPTGLEVDAPAAPRFRLPLPAVTPTSVCSSPSVHPTSYLICIRLR